MTDFDIDPGAFEELTSTALARAGLARVAEGIAEDARSGASRVSRRLAEAIDVEAGADAAGVFADIGYRRDKPGFALWWHEVGTAHYPATPHLRPALRARRLT